jgi:hypothetical protein
MDLVGWPINIGIIIAPVVRAWWRSEQSAARPATKPANVPPPAIQQQAPDSPLTPRMIGETLAHYLGEHCTIDSLSSDEKNIVAAIGMPLERYYKAALGLAAFSIDYGIIALLHDMPFQELVRAGYVTGISKIGDANKTAAICFALKKYGQIYKDAADDFFRHEPGWLGNPLDDTFHELILAEYLAAAPTTAMGFNTTLLAQVAVQHYFFGYQAVAQTLFTESGLVNAPA